MLLENFRKKSSLKQLAFVASLFRRKSKIKTKITLRKQLVSPASRTRTITFQLTRSPSIIYAQEAVGTSKIEAIDQLQQASKEWTKKDNKPRKSQRTNEEI